MKNRVLHTPEGVRDIYGMECEQKIRLEDQLHRVLHAYGFKNIETPTFEYFDVFSEERGTVSSRNMYKFFDREGNTLVLRPDITPSIARCVASYFKDERLPMRLCYLENIYINNDSYQGRMKENTQIGAELVNDASVDADAEMIALSIHSLVEVGLTEFQIEIGQVEFFKCLVHEANLSHTEEEELRLRIEEKNLIAVENLLKEKEIASWIKEIFLELPEMFGSLDKLIKLKEKTKNQCAKAAIRRLEEIYEVLVIYGLETYVTFDLGKLSKYNYYTGIIFQAFTYELGEPILGGGRYDNLVGQFGKKAPAIGMAIHVDQLMLALSRQKKLCQLEPSSTLIIYQQPQRLAAIQLASQFRKEQMEVELFCTEQEISKQDLLSYAKDRQIGGMLIFKKDYTIQVLNATDGKTQETTIQHLLQE